MSEIHRPNTLPISLSKETGVIAVDNRFILAEPLSESDDASRISLVIAAPKVVQVGYRKKEIEQEQDVSINLSNPNQVGVVIPLFIRNSPLLIGKNYDVVYKQSDGDIFQFQLHSHEEVKSLTELDIHTHYREYLVACYPRE